MNPTPKDTQQDQDIANLRKEIKEVRKGQRDHNEECKVRYAKQDADMEHVKKDIGEVKDTVKSMDNKIWGMIVIILAAAGAVIARAWFGV